MKNSHLCVELSCLIVKHGRRDPPVCNLKESMRLGVDGYDFADVEQLATLAGQWS